MTALDAPERQVERRPPRPAAPTALRAAIVVASNDLRRKLRDRTALLSGIVTPLVMAAVIGFAFGGGVDFSAQIAVVDADTSSTSQGIVDGLTGDTPEDAPVDLVPRTDLLTAERQLADGSVDAVIVVPAGFGESVATMAGGGRPAPLQVVTDADKRIAGDVARSIAEGVGARIGTTVLAVATATELQAGVAEPATVDEILAAARGMSAAIVLAQLDVGETYSPVAYFAASMGILFLFFTVGAGARSLITERREGTLQRVRSAPVSDAAVLSGKSLGVFVVGLLSLVTIWVVTTVVFRASWGDPVAVFAVIVASVVAVSGISALVAGLARTDAQADGLTAVVAFVFALLGGSFLQPGSLPPLLQSLTLFTPNGWALRAITAIGAGGAQLGDVLVEVGVLCAIGSVTAVVGVRALRARVVS